MNTTPIGANLTFSTEYSGNTSKSFSRVLNSARFLCQFWSLFLLFIYVCLFIFIFKRALSTVIDIQCKDPGSASKELKNKTKQTQKTKTRESIWENANFSEPPGHGAEIWRKGFAGNWGLEEVLEGHWWLHHNQEDWQLLSTSVALGRGRRGFLGWTQPFVGMLLHC